jgi:di/tricarboxylate transporter
MGWEGVVTLAVVGLILVGLARHSGAADTLFGGGLTILMTLSVFSDRLPSPGDVVSAFGNEGLFTVGVLFVVAAGLRETGGLSLIADKVLGRPRNVGMAKVRLLPFVTGTSALLNNTPVVAMFIPTVQEWARRAGLSQSKLLMPLSYAAILGGTLTLVGTSTNLVVKGLLDELAHETGGRTPTFSMWTITPVGFVVCAVGLGFLVFLASKFLPDRDPVDFVTTDPREYTVEMLVEPESAVDGRSIEEAGLRNLPGAYLVEVQRGEQTLVAVGPDEILLGGDRLVFVGVVDSVVDLQRTRGLVPATDQVFKLEDPRRSRLLIEAVVSESCPVSGVSVREGKFRTRYEAAVIAVHRNGQRLSGKIGDIVLAPGDALLLEAHPRFLTEYRNSQDFLLVSAVESSEPRTHEHSGIALAILVGMITAMGFENVLGLSVLNIALIGAGLMILTGCCSLSQARRSIDWATLIAIGSSFGIAKAMEKSGAAEWIAGIVVSPLIESKEIPPIAALAAVYVLTLLFTEFATNNAAAALSFPIALSVATTLGVSVMPFAVAVAIASSAGFALPSGYATHLMVHAAGGYRLGDWLRLGIPMDILVGVTSVLIIPVVFPF